MENKKFVLSEKGEIGDCICGDEFDIDVCKWFKEEDVKKAVQLLKEVLKKQGLDENDFNEIMNEINSIFGDEIVGEKLTNGK